MHLLIPDAPGKLKRFEAAMDSVLNQLRHKDSLDYEIMVLKNLKQLTKRYQAGNIVLRNNIRDSQMAQNLEWLIRKKYPKEKVIVWAASAHISKGAPSAYQLQTQPITWMGSVFTRDTLNNRETYVLGFSSKSGTYRRVFDTKTLKASKPGKNGFETCIVDEYQYMVL